MENIACAVIASGWLASVDPNASEIQFYNDFEDVVPHVYTAQDLLDHWNGATTSSITGGSVEVVKDPANCGQGNVMRVAYKGGEHGFAGGGAQWRTRVGAHEELYFAYDIYFPGNFEFVKGGKIPGLMGGPDIHTGNNTPDGTTGWSGRLNWRVDGKPVTYMYTYDYGYARGAKDVRWDNGPGGQQYFIPGQWHRVEMRYKMNTPGKNNGIHQAWIDGELAVDMTLGYRTKSSVKVDEILFSTFYGGGDSSFAPLNDNYIYFDNFVVSTQPITHQQHQLKFE